MKIVVIGGTGLIGSRVVALLQQLGHEVLPASPSRGVNALTGEGLEPALQNAEVVVDVSNSPSFEPGPVMEFFQTSTRNLLAAERRAGVAHHVALSIVGLERVPGNGYFQAKLAQEEQIKASGIPYTLVRATQFAEFVAGIAESMSQGESVTIPDAQLQPIAASDVSAEVARAAEGEAANQTLDIAGPEAGPMAEFVRQLFTARGDRRQVGVDPAAHYFGAPVHGRDLVPAGEARLGQVRFTDWLAHCN